jgi:hypothetical protein
MDFLRKLWVGWKRFGQMIGDFLARAVLTIFYFTIFMPFGLAVRLLSDPLAMKVYGETPAWQKRETTDLTLEDAGKQA